MTFPCDLRWASDSGAQGMPHPEELEYLGWKRLREHPSYAGVWLMVRAA